MGGRTIKYRFYCSIFMSFDNTVFDKFENKDTELGGSIAVLILKKIFVFESVSR